MHANRDSCEVVKRKTKPYKDTKCADCGVKYSSRKQLMSHREKAHPIEYRCPTCARTFKRRRDWQRHTETHRPEKRLTCDKCSYSAFRKHRLRYHMDLHHAQPQVSHWNKLNRADSILQVNQLQEAENKLPGGVEEQEKNSDRLSLAVPSKPTLPPIPNIRFGACFM